MDFVSFLGIGLGLFGAAGSCITVWRFLRSNSDAAFRKIREEANLAKQAFQRRALTVAAIHLGQIVETADTSFPRVPKRSKRSAHSAEVSALIEQIRDLRQQIDTRRLQRADAGRIEGAIETLNTLSDACSRQIGNRRNIL